MGLSHVLLPELRLAGDLLVAAVGRVPHVHQGTLRCDSIAKYWSINFIKKVSFLLEILFLGKFSKPLINSFYNTQLPTG